MESIFVNLSMFENPSQKQASKNGFLLFIHHHYHAREEDKKLKKKVEQINTLLLYTATTSSSSTISVREWKESLWSISRIRLSILAC